MERQKPRSIDWIQAPYFVCPFVAQESLTFYCTLCNSRIASTRTLITHIQGKFHVSLLDYHGRYISPLEHNLYWCKVCNCVIPRYENVHKHLNGRGHCFRIQRFQEKRECYENLEHITAKVNELYNRLQDILRGTDFVRANAISINEDYNLAEEKKEGKGGTNNIKTDDNENNNDCSRLEEKRNENGTMNTVKAESKENNNDCSPFNETTVKNDAQNNVQAKANDSINDYSRLEEKRVQKSATVSKKAKAGGNNECNDLDEKREEKIAETHVQASANDINDGHKMNCSPQSKLSSLSCSLDHNYDVVPTTPEVNEYFQYCSADSGGNDKKILEGTVFNNLSNDTSSTQDSGIEENTLISPSPPSEKIVEPTNAAKASTKTYNQTFVDLLDFQSHMYDLRDRISETRLSMDLCLQTEKGQIYCLICHQIVANSSDICTEHLCSPDLREYDESIRQNGGNSNEFTGEFGSLNLASQYLECFSAEVINCLVCKAQLRNVDFAIQNHVLGNIHSQKLGEMRTKMRKIFEKMSSRWLFDWYKVQKFSCIPCSEKYESEFEFAKHLNTEEHADALKKAKDFGRPFVYDFCAICAIFWCGYRDTYTSHCEGRLHKWFQRNGERVASKLPESAQQFLAKLGTQNDEAIDSVNSACAKEELNKIKLVESLGNLKLVFPSTQACAFGSKMSSRCVIDVFLGCEKMNDGRTFTEDDILYYMMSVNNWMSGKSETWNLKPLATGGRSPIINAIHKPTGLACVISFDNGLVISGLQFIDAFDDIFPSCCKLMKYLNQWLAHCKLTGSQQISNYMLYWLLVFYLQKESILPSVATLTQTIDGFQAGGSKNFVNKDANNNVFLKELLIGFFKFYANFDFHHDVACPLIGKVVKKRFFAYPENLPTEMGFYIAHVMYSNNPEEFPIDSPMCIQDPFSLNHNFSKDVSKVDLSNFRTYCAKTADFLSPS